jgi:hypothetical protein
MTRTKNKLFFCSLVFLSFHFPSVKTNKSHQEWGFYGHKKINEWAVFTLPKEMKTFYKKNIDFIIQHSVDPDKRRYSIVGEAECHFIDLDYYNSDHKHKANLPLKWKDAICQFDEDSLKKHGIVPWHVQSMLVKLTQAFIERNNQKILKYSAEIGHYIADAHVPLHTTSNYNGQKTGQYGIHGFWETKIPELFGSEFNLVPSKAKLLNYPEIEIWEKTWQSHFALDSVFQFEKQTSLLFPDELKKSLVKRGDETEINYSSEYSLHYFQLLNGQTERRMRSAIQCVGDFWYTAWINAGQPEF